MNIFDYSMRNVADQMRTSWDKISEYVGTECGNDIANELKNKRELVIPEPTYSNQVQTRQTNQEQAIRTAQANMTQAKQDQLAGLQARQGDPDAPEDLPVTLATLENEITMLQLEQAEPVEVKMTKEEETLYSNEWRTYRERNSKLAKCRGQACNLIRGQCA